MTICQAIETCSYVPRILLNGKICWLFNREWCKNMEKVEDETSKICKDQIFLLIKI